MKTNKQWDATNSNCLRNVRLGMFMNVCERFESNDVNSNTASALHKAMC